jgi:hypothetical protein
VYRASVLGPRARGRTEALRPARSLRQRASLAARWRSLRREGLLGAPLVLPPALGRRLCGARDGAVRAPLRAV